MSQQGSTGKRVFRPGDPGIPEEGIIVGRGGGFTFFYQDLVLLPEGSIRFMTYMAEDGEPIPEDHESARLLIADEGQQFSHFAGRLDDIGFHSINLPPHTSTITDYLIFAHKDKGLHAVEFAPGGGSAPPELLAIYRSVRTFVTEAFAKTHGGS